MRTLLETLIEPSDRRSALHFDPSVFDDREYRSADKTLLGS